ncbi:alcohol oxidase [Mycena maculata]|uniref:Alcohol oxidase n=1 Tax=Mycena maculata TaxID=230809 RepID=A0AAD7JLR5_9AGAR|nr:alcohol oxidase [Mycena maculata]
MELTVATPLAQAELGGTAGCCLASRLSEDPNISVLLLERGPLSDDWQAHVPLLSSNFYHPGAPAAIFPLSPLAHVDQRRLHAVWKNMGRETWGYDVLEPYFVKSERTLSQPPSSFRGNDGVWLNQTFPTPFLEMARRIPKAVTSLGIPQSPDLNSPVAPVVCSATVDIAMDRNMHRHSTLQAFLPPKVAHARKKNLKICVNTIVTQIKFATDDNPGMQHPKAVGVYFEDTRSKRTSARFFARASREVILCAGAIGSPQILMLSGVGPRDHLSRHSLGLVRDLPGVGSYLRDHVGIPVSYEVPIHESLNILRNSIFQVLSEVVKYLLFGSGLLSVPFVQTTIFLRSLLLNENLEIVAAPGDLNARNPDNIPDIEVMPFGYRGGEAKTSPLDRVGVFSLLAALVKPKSFGSVRLASTDPHARAQVDLGYFSDPEDILVARKAVRFALRLGEQVRAQGYPLKDLVVPDSETDDQSLGVFMRKSLLTTYHYTSTCRMAPEDGPQSGVVDDDLKVHGIDGLRICDCSVFPDILSTHPMAGAVVVAEKCADLIKKSP